MKTLWLALSVLAIANLLAFLGFVGWLKMSDRLDGDRLKAVRTILAKTIAEEKSEADELTRKEAAAKAEADEAERKGRPPLTASEQLIARLEASEIDEQKIKAMVSSIETLRAPLLNNILLVGGNTLFPNYAQRMFAPPPTAALRVLL